MDEMTNDVIETEAETIDDTENQEKAFYVTPGLAIVGLVGVAAIGIGLARKKIAAVIDGVQKKAADSWCAKHGKMYVDIVDDSKDDEN